VESAASLDDSGASEKRKKEKAKKKKERKERKEKETIGEACAAIEKPEVDSAAAGVSANTSVEMQSPDMAHATSVDEMLVECKHARTGDEIGTDGRTEIPKETLPVHDDQHQLLENDDKFTEKDVAENPLVENILVKSGEQTADTQQTTVETVARKLFSSQSQRPVSVEAVVARKSASEPALPCRTQNSPFEVSAKPSTDSTVDESVSGIDCPSKATQEKKKKKKKKGKTDFQKMLEKYNKVYSQGLVSPRKQGSTAFGSPQKQGSSAFGSPQKQASVGLVSPLKQSTLGLESQQKQALSVMLVPPIEAQTVPSQTEIKGGLASKVQPVTGDVILRADAGDSASESTPVKLLQPPRTPDLDSRGSNSGLGRAEGAVWLGEEEETLLDYFDNLGQQEHATPKCHNITRPALLQVGLFFCFLLFFFLFW
jgi:hypothetical protein